jgi:hypothetical protein
LVFWNKKNLATLQLIIFLLGAIINVLFVPLKPANRVSEDLNAEKFF